MNDEVSESAFYMWRTLISVAHADNIVTDEEIEFIANIMDDVKFSDQQTSILKDDIVNAKDVNEMFKGISDPKDRVRFFNFVRDLVWIDGDFDSQEQSVMIKLYQQNMKSTNIDDLIGKTSLEFEEDFDIAHREVSSRKIKDKKTGFRRILSSLRSNFLPVND